MGVCGYGSFFCLWAVRARSARGRVFTEPWAMPPTACTMKIERGVVYNPTIHHGYLLEKNRHPGRRQPWRLPPPIGRGRSARGCALTGPWATPPAAGAMKIERGWMYYPTIHHGDYLGKKVNLGTDRAMREDPYRRCHANRAEVYAVSYLV